MIRQLLALATGAVTLYGMWAAGSHRWWAWLVGLGNQLLWISFIVMFAAWGLLPLSLALVAVYGRNALKWRSERVAAP